MKIEEIRDIQKQVVQNKINHGFNTTDMNQEFVLLYGEVAEAYDAWKKKTNLGEELADVAIYLLGIAELNGIDLYSEIIKKMDINRVRKYTIDDRGNAQKCCKEESESQKK